MSLVLLDKPPHFSSLPAGRRIEFGLKAELNQERKPSSTRSIWSVEVAIGVVLLLLQFSQLIDLTVLVAAAILPYRRNSNAADKQDHPGNYAMPPKKVKGKEPTQTTLWQHDKPGRMSLRSEAEQESTVSNEKKGDQQVTLTEIPVSSEAEQEDVVPNDQDGEDTFIDCDAEQLPEEAQMSNNEIAKLLRSQIAEVRIDIKSLDINVTTNAAKIDRINVSMSDISGRVETISSESKTIWESVRVNRSDIDDVVKQQNDYNEKHAEILTLAKSLREKDDLIEIMLRRIENLEDEIKASKDREEIKEQHSRKMNLWIYGVDEPDKENIKHTFKDFCTTVLGHKKEFVDSWMIKNVHRVGEYNSPKRPIIVAFVLWENRQAMLMSTKNLHQYNTDNNTSFSVKTDLAPRARQLRKDLHYVNKKMKEAEHCEGRVRDNAKGYVWLERKDKKEDRYWSTVLARDINPDYLPPHLKANRRTGPLDNE